MLCPFAEWRGPVPGRTPGGMGAVVGAVFHIMGASMSAADGWFHNSSSRVSAHFGIGNDGRLVQWVDTADRAWHAGAANSHWIGVETEGSGGPLSDAGIATFARLYLWLHEQYGIPFGITDDPNSGHGLGWHGMGGAAWGGHDYCPGPERRAQRARVIQIASGQQPAPQPAFPQEDDVSVFITTAGEGIFVANGPHARWVRNDDDLKGLVNTGQVKSGQVFGVPRAAFDSYEFVGAYKPTRRSVTEVRKARSLKRVPVETGQQIAAREGFAYIDLTQAA